METLVVVMVTLVVVMATFVEVMTKLVEVMALLVVVIAKLVVVMKSNRNLIMHFTMHGKGLNLYQTTFWTCLL